MNAPLCPRLAELLSLRDEDRLSFSEERLLREHFAACDACALEALRHDPVLLFSRSATPESLSAEACEKFVDGVLSATFAAKAERRLRSARFRGGLRLAASLLLAAGLIGVWVARGPRGGTPEGGSAPVAVAREGVGAVPETVPAVEEIGGEGAVVYQFPATQPGEATVVFVVDRNADI